MDVRALARNWRTAGSITSSLIDRVGYMRWIYRAVKGRGAGLSIPIRFRFAPPIGEATLHVRPNNGSDAFVFSEVFIHRCYALTLRRPPATILDLGANAGFATLFLARVYPHASIACVEPVPANVAVLERNIAANGLGVTVIAKAIATHDGEVVMAVAGNDYGHKIANIAFGRPLDGATIAVPAVTVSTLLSELGWSRIDLLKVDIEGYEGVLLTENAGWLSRVDTMCIECHEGFGEAEIRAVAATHAFADIARLDSGLWLLTR